MEQSRTLPVYSSMGTSTGAPDPPSDDEVKKIVAVSLIEKVYLAYRDRQMFTLLKHAICAAEKSWTYEFLRKISPLEADLLKDPTIKARVRLRFAGNEFPPVIVFKIYLVGVGTKYISGRRTIQPATEAASDACQLMGHRKFYDQMIIDACQHEKYKITDEVDVTTMQDYMQYLSNVDETPSYLGGRENYWRQLTLEALPRQSIMYDIVEYLQTRSPSDRLRSEMPTIMSRPITQDIQLQHIRAISRLQAPRDTISAPQGSSFRRIVTESSQSKRRSVQAKRRVSQMRKLYGLDSAAGETFIEDDSVVVKADQPQLQPKTDTVADYNSKEFSNEQLQPGNESRAIFPSAAGRESEIQDQEAKELFRWTQELNFEDVSQAIGSGRSRDDPRLRSTPWSSRAVYTSSG